MPHRVRTHLTYANVMSSFAVFVVLGGTSYAAATGAIDSREIKNNTIRSKDIATNGVGRAETAKNSVGSTEVANGSLLRSDFKSGQIPAGATGPAGPAGPAGAAGSARAFGRVDAKHSWVDLRFDWVMYPSSEAPGAEANTQ